MEHAKIEDANVARALRSTGRMVRSAHGEVVGAQTGPVGCYDEHAPYTLADPAPLTDEQAKAAAKAGAVVQAPGSHPLRMVNGRWQHKYGEAWDYASHNVPGDCMQQMRDRWHIAPDPSRAAESMDAIECEEHAGVPAEEYRLDEDEPVTFGHKAAMAALESGLWVTRPDGSQVGCLEPWMDCVIGSDQTPTAEQVSAIVKAEPERLCANDGEGDGELDYAMWDGERWTFFDGDTRTGNPDRGPRITSPWRLAIRPDYKPAEERESITVESEPQDVHVTLSSDETGARLYVNGRLFVPSEDEPEPQDTPSAFWDGVRDISEAQRKLPAEIRALADVPSQPFHAERLRGYKTGERQCVAEEQEQPKREMRAKWSQEASDMLDAENELIRKLEGNHAEPQDTLLACMRWCRDNETAAWAIQAVWLKAGSGCAFLIDLCGSLDVDGARLTAANLEATDWQLSTDEGATWFSPSKGPEVEPAYDPREDKIKRAMLASADGFGRGDGTFNLAHFQSSVEELAGSMPTGDMCKFMLSGRVDVQQLSPGDAHYRVHIKPPLGEPPKFEVEPESGAELWAWMANNPERVVIHATDPEGGGPRGRFNLPTQFGPHNTVSMPLGPCVPEHGTWESEGE